MSTCPTEEELAGYALGTCVEAAALRIRTHVRTCQRCSKWLANAKANNGIAAEVLRTLRSKGARFKDGCTSPGCDN